MVNSLHKEQIADSSIVEEDELASTGTLGSAYSSSLVVSNIDSVTKTITISSGDLKDPRVQNLDIIVIVGGLAAGEYTVDTIISDKIFTVNETIPNATSGSIGVFYRSGAEITGYDPSDSIIFGPSENTVKKALDSIDYTSGGGGGGTIAESSETASDPVAYTGALGLVVADSMVLSPTPGRHLLNFNSQYSSSAASITAEAATDLQSLISDLNALPATGSRGNIFGTETVTPGVYTIAGAVTSTTLTTLTLDAQGDPNALFVFRMSAAYSTGAGFNVVLFDGANSNNVFFLAVGAIALGAGTDFKGNLISTNGAVGLGTGTSLEGRMASNLGAMSLTNSIVAIPTIPSVLDMGVFERFAIFTSSGAVANTLPSTITGDIGTNLGAVTGFTTSTVSGSIYTPTSVGSIITFGIYVDGVLEVDTDRTIISGVDVDGDVIHMFAMVTTTVGQTLDIRILVGAGGVTIGNRAITSLKVG
jgi:hypothetical protein